MREREPFLVRREIAYRLREQTQAAGLIRRELAKQLGRDEPTISHWLRGSRVIREADVAAVLTACGVPRAEWDELLRLVRAQPAPTSILLRGQREHTGYRDHLADPQTVVEVAATHVPRLAQTTGYAQAWAGQAGCVLAARHPELLPRATPVSSTRPWLGPRVTLLVHEATLRAKVGEPTVMVEQRSRLRWLAGLPYVELRIIPGQAHTTADTAGSFTLARYYEHRPVVLRHEPGGLALCDDPDYVEDHEQTIVRLLALAWDTKRTGYHLRFLAPRPIQASENRWYQQGVRRNATIF